MILRVPAVALDDGIRDEIATAWLRPGDAARNSVLAAVIPAPSPAAADGQTAAASGRRRTLRVLAEQTGAPATANAPIEVWLQRAAEDIRMPLVALLPPGSGSNNLSPYGKTVSAYLDELQQATGTLIFKWRGGILVSNDAAWFVEDHNDVPYALIKRYLQGNRDFVPLTDLVKLVVGLDGSDTGELARRYPIVAAALEFRPVFLLYKRNPAILTPRGMALDAETIGIVRSVPSLASRVSDRAGGIRLMQQTQRTSDGRVLTIQIEIYDVASGKWHAIAGIAVSVHHP